MTSSFANCKAECNTKKTLLLYFSKSSSSITSSYMSETFHLDLVLQTELFLQNSKVLFRATSSY